MPFAAKAVLGLITGSLTSAAVLAAAGAESTPAVVSHVNVVSDKVPDVSSLEAWKKSYLKDDMTNTQKAMAIWKSVVTFTFDCTQPLELLDDENGVRDPIKAFNVYGYGLCSDLAAHVESLGRYSGFQARGWALKGHSVPELFYDNSWHLLDGAYINYWPKADGQLAGMDEISAELKAFFAQHPELAGDDKKLKEFCAKEGWKKGPDVMSRCPTLNENGLCPEGYHGWWSFAKYYGNPQHVYEYGSALGYELNIQLRPGEKLIRNWGHKQMFVNMDGTGGNPNLTPVGKDTLGYSPAYGDLAPGRLGNGTLEYRVPLAQVGSSALACENLVASGASLAVQDAARPGVLVLRMPSSYIYLAGQMDLKATVPAGGDLLVEFSDNNGLDWKPVAPSITGSGEQKLDLKSLVYRRYDYRLRFTASGAGTSLDALTLTHNIQHSQRALPALDKGDNQITFTTGAQEGTISYHASMDPTNKGKQLVLEDLHPTLNGLTPNNLRSPDGKGDATFQVSTPGEMTRLRFGMNWRARGAADFYDVQVSFDQGKTFKSIQKLEGPTAAQSAYFVFSDVPAGTTSAQVRVAASQKNTLMMFAMRISADYKEPGSGFRPVKVTYDWEENGKPRQDVHIARGPQETYSIHCDGKPAMKSISMELAD